MFDYISARDIANKWNISQRRVAIFCMEGRIKNAKKLGNMWLIPKTAEKPIDKRTIRYEKQKKVELKPFVKWVGGKGQLIEQLEKHIPTDGEKVLTKYAEPFVGGGALLFNILSKYNFESLYIGDTNAELINAYNVVKNNVEELIKKLVDMQLAFVPMDENGRKYYYYTARDKFNSLILNKDTAIEKASLFIFLNKTCFNGLYRVNKKGQFNVPMGAYKNPTICDEYNLRNVSEALQYVTIVCGDYSLSKDFIDKYTEEVEFYFITSDNGFTKQKSAIEKEIIEKYKNKFTIIDGNDKSKLYKEINIEVELEIEKEDNVFYKKDINVDEIRNKINKLMDSFIFIETIDNFGNEEKERRFDLNKYITVEKTERFLDNIDKVIAENIFRNEIHIELFFENDVELSSYHKIDTYIVKEISEIYKLIKTTEYKEALINYISERINENRIFNIFDKESPEELPF